MQRLWSWVAPLVGAWIEIAFLQLTQAMAAVAPLVGAWIEIQLRNFIDLVFASLPLWERGLKSVAP